jgi:hypothetical protein
MRQEFSDRLRLLLQDKFAGSWRDGWVYGRLKQEFNLQPEELNALATTLGFKYGWNRAVQDILENQWQEDEVRWMQQELTKVQKQVSLNRQKVSTSQKIAALLQELEALDNKPRRELTDIERALVALILKMQSDEQIWVLEMIFNRYK